MAFGSRMAFSLAAALTLAQGFGAFAADPPPHEESINLGRVSDRPADLIQRFLTLTPAQAEKIQQLLRQQMTAREELIAQVDKQLNAQFGALMTGELDDKQKETFAKIQDAVAAYLQACRDSEEAFAADWAKVAGAPPSRQFTLFDVLLQLPGAGKAEQELSTKSSMEYFRQFAADRAKALREAGIGAPPLPNQAAEWEEYSRRSAPIIAAVQKKVLDDYLARIRAQLGDKPAGKNFDRLVRVVQARNDKTTAAMDALVGKLKPLVGVEKLIGAAPAATK